MPFPTITATSTDVWLDFWNVTFKDWLESQLVSGSGSGWPLPFVLNGRVMQTEDDGLSVSLTSSPGLALVLPEGSEWLLDGNYHLIDADKTVSGLPANFEGWAVPVAEYSEEFETWSWSWETYETRPSTGSGVAAKIITISDRVSSLTTTEDEVDVIPVLPVLLNRIRNGGGGGGGVQYLSELAYSPQDPRNAVTVIEEKIAECLASALDAVEAGGVKETPTNVDQLWDNFLSLARAVREVYPQAMRFLNIAAVRPGVYGTASAPDTEVFDLGGTLLEVTSDRHYDPS